MVRCLDLVKHVKKTQRRINSEDGNEVGRNITYKQDFYNNCGPCGGEVGRVDEKKRYAGRKGSGRDGEATCHRKWVQRASS